MLKTIIKAILGSAGDDTALCPNCKRADCADNAACLTNCHLFVYGTLKQGHGNHRLLEGAQFLGNAITANKNYFLSSIHCVDAPIETAAVQGELYIVPTGAQWERLDRLESHPRLYRRMIRTFITEAGKEVDAWIYISQVGGIPSEALCRKVPRHLLNDAGHFEYQPYPGFHA